MNNTDYNNAVLERIKKTEALLEQVNDKTAYVYVMAENGLKEDYELVGDKENADRVAKDIIYKIGKKLVPYKNGGDLAKLRKCLVHAYDTRARCGDFESFCIALEWKRPIEKQFYIPRMKLMRKHGVTQGIQDLIDDKLDLLVLNLPPRIGKALKNSTPVLTKNGWKKHGDLQVGDYVLNNNGEFVKVLATSCEYQCNCRITFSNGEQIDCHENHEWVVHDRYTNEEFTLETKEMIGRVICDNEFRFEIFCDSLEEHVKEFSETRRIVITNIERIENGEMGKCIQVEGGIYLAGSTLIPTHNSTIGLFLQAMLGGLYPDESILGAGHSVSLIQSFYNEILNIINGEEYRYHEIFPNANVVSKSAEYFFIDLNNTKRFHTYNYVSIESGGTGKVQAERLLYCDDLIKGKEQVNNPDVLEKLYYNYTSTIKDRKVQRLCKDGVYRTCPEIHICTPWSLHDVTSRVVQNAKDSGDLDRVRIVSIPCYDENGESNFEYDYGKGFSKEYYKEMELAEDPVIFSAKYLMTPVERDGLVFNKDNVSFYRNLPSRTPDRIVAYADVSHGGEDYFSMPIGYVYDDEVYIEDILFRNKFGGDDYIRPLVKEKLMKNNVSRLGIEKNNGGDFFSTLVDKDLKKSNYRCNITTHNAPTNKSKLDRILACQNEIKGIATETNTYKIYFKLPENIKGDSEYQDAMRQLFNWNQSHSAQSKQHDDFPDSLAGLITNVLNGKARGVVRSIKGDFLE